MKSLSNRPCGAVATSAAPRAASLSLRLSLALCTALMAAPAHSTEGPGLLGEGHWRLVVSPFSQHFRPSDEHKYVWAIGAERQRDDNWLAGGSYFRNSFGQPSAYLYVGKRFPQMWGQPKLFGQLSGGLLYGYRGAYEDKVPLNNNGFSPGALVSLGWQFDKRTAFTAHMLGDAAIMFQLSIDLR